MSGGNQVKIIDRGNGQQTVLGLNGEILRGVLAYRIERGSDDKQARVTFTIAAETVELLGQFGQEPAP